ncbi:hypothetical protein [Halofilum ochraceum]|uniref:hypothetical protein n=1 Tax=Halofilum ochraceum TaxID=1611323 RepID=UPI0008D8FE66|nr:hypothetical protein [Halofilum ochraceum]
MTHNLARAAGIGIAILMLAGCSGSISEPWVSGSQAEKLESERTRSAEQKQALRDRLENYAGAYQ